jgi:uncharacterized protein YecT (DUF1311 family)
VKVTLRHCFAVVVFLSLSATAQSGNDSKPAPPFDPCQKATTEIERTNCWDELANKAEAQLTATYSKVLKAVNARITSEKVAALKSHEQGVLANLRSSQLAWKKYRGANCDANAQIYEGGTIEPQIRSGCMKELAERRAADLQKTYAMYLHGQ